MKIGLQDISICFGPKSHNMESNREALQKAIDAISNYGTTKGIVISAEEMARKTGVTEKQWYAWLNDEEETPADMATKLKVAYGVTSVMIQFTEEEEVAEPPENLPENEEVNRNALQHIIDSSGSLEKPKE